METAKKVTAKKVTTNVVSEAKPAKRIIEPTVKAKKAKVDKPAKKVTFADQLDGNKQFKEQRNVECKKLGYALGLLEKHIECFHPLMREYIRAIRNEKHLYQLAELKCKRTKSGNFSPWLLQSYVREKVNNA
jgi:hypothetical protein